MSLYRSLLAAVAAIAIAAPVFADDTTTATTTDTTAATQTTGTTDQQAVKINLNTATAKDLTKVKGLNASKAKAIIAFRNKQTDKKFTSVDQLANVKGFKKMKPETMKMITDQLTVE